MLKSFSFQARTGACALLALALALAQTTVFAQSPVVQTQYFGAPVSPVVAVDLSDASSRPLGQPALTSQPGIGNAAVGVVTYGQRVQAESSPRMFTAPSGTGQPLRP